MKTLGKTKTTSNMRDFIHTKWAGIVGSIIGCLLFIILPVWAQTAVEGWQKLRVIYLVEANDIVTYHHVVPADGVNSRDADIPMRSHVTWHEDGWDVEWNDVLTCPSTGFYSSQTLNKNDYQADDLGNYEVKPWTYTGKRPQ